MKRCITRAAPVALSVVFLAFQSLPCLGALSQPGSDDTETASVSLSPEELGDIAMARREYVAAVQDYIDAPKTAEVWNKLGVAYHHLFAMREAERAYRQALHMRHRYPQALNNLGAVFYAQHKYRKAERFYRRALRLNPRAAATYSNLGTAYFAQGREKKGIAAYRKAFALNPQVFSDMSSELVAESLPIRERAEEDYCIARLFAEAGKVKQAIDYLRRALDEGFSNRGEIWHDQMLASLRATPAFVQLMSEEKIRR
jgi:tetratricopeptide (TPR) repeat protein